MISKSIFIWRIVQTLVWLLGIFILFSLVFSPTIGIHMFWNILIPVAPALLIVAVGLWRNICPLASTALFLRHMNFSKRKKIKITQIEKLNLIAIVALFIIVPLRHLIFNMNGPATAILIISLGGIAILMGYFFEWKSGWCSGLCPVHPVEKLYGSNNKLSLENAHCDKCHHCVEYCPDSGLGSLWSKKSIYHKISSFLMVGAFPGFVWGWFQVPDFSNIVNIEQLLLIYKFPFIGMLATSVLFLIMSRIFEKNFLIRFFAASAVSCYYWFRLPALFGFGIFPEDGMLVDLTNYFPEWSMTVSIYVLSLFFFGWMMFKIEDNKNWLIISSVD